MDNPGDVWQVMVNGEVYDADLETLKQWIVEGAVQPQDKVRRGKLNWLDAGRVPALRGAFGGDVAPSSPSSLPPVDPPSYGGSSYGGATYGAPSTYGGSTYGAGASSGYDESFGQPSYGAAPTYGGGAAHRAAPVAHGAVTCLNHPAVPATHACVSCGAGFCKPCRKIVNNVTLCASCGQFCKPVEEYKRQVAHTSDKYGGFGLNDLARAITYPLSNPIGLTIMTVIYGALLLAGWRGRLLAVAMTISCMSVAINRLSMGRFDEGYMPDASSGAFDIFISPIKLAFGIGLITFGPLVVAFYLGASGLISSMMEGELSTGRLGLAVILGLFGIAWSLFYYPMALLVAGFTQSFLATINPIVGFDTIWRMGWDYVKAYLMCIVAFVIQGVLAFMFHQLTITDSRSIPAAAMVLFGYILEGGSSFYAYMVIAGVLGLALFKCSDKLELGVGGRV